jgi:hypothetical protein
MKKNFGKKLALETQTLLNLSVDQLTAAAGGDYTERRGCKETQPMSFCICATKHNCSINC